jgi:O-antigen ligase
MVSLEKNQGNKPLAIFLGILVSLGVFKFLPILSKNLTFLMALPFAFLYFILMFVNVQATLVILLFSRVMLDSIFNLTKVDMGGQQNIGIGGILNLFVIIFSLYLLIRNRKSIKQAIPVNWWLVFLLVCGLAIFYTPLLIRDRAVRLLINLLSYAAVFVIPYCVISNIAQKKFYIKVLIFSSILPLIFAYFTLLHGGVTYGEDEGMRVQGSFTHPNILAFYLVLIITIVFYTLKNPQFNLSKGKKRLLLIYILIVSLLLILTKTRSAWIACWWLFFIYGLLKERKYLFFALLLPALALVTPIVSSRIKDALYTSHGVGKGINSFAWRLELWQSSLPWIRDKLITGHGLTSFEYFSPSFSPFRNEHNPAHNTYIEILFESGLFGLISYLLLYLSILRKFFSKMFDAANALSKTYAIIFAYILTYLLVCSSDNLLYYLVFNWYFWFFIGVAASSLKIENEENIGNHPVL